MTAKKNLAVDHGFTWNFETEFEDLMGNPINLTGHTVTVEVLKNNGTVIGAYPCTVGLGTISLTVPDEVTATWPVGGQVWQLIHETPNGDKYRLVLGELKVVRYL